MKDASGRSCSGEGTRGFTLLEIAVSLAILTLSMTFVFAAFLSRQQSFLAQEEITRMQRNIRTGMGFLERDLRSAGYGFPPGVAVRIPHGLTGGVPVLLVSGLGVADGGTSAPDNLYVAHLSSAPTRLAFDMERSSSGLQVQDTRDWKAGDIGIVFDSGDSDLFRVSRVGRRLERAPGDTFPSDLTKVYGEGSSVARLAFAGYFVGPDTGKGHTALFRTGVDSSGAPVSRVIAEDIEDMQVRLYFPNGAERDVEGPGLDPSPLAGAVGVRVHLAARGRLVSPGIGGVPVAKWNRTDVVSLSTHRGHGRRTMEGFFGFRNRGIEP